MASLAVQIVFAELWAEKDASSKVHVLPTIQAAVELVGDLAEELETVQVFVTGSFHLIGGVLSVLEGVLTPTSPAVASK